MPFRVPLSAALTAVLLLVTGAVSSAFGPSPAPPEAGAGAIAGALEAARASIEPEYRLEVRRTDGAGQRSFTIYPSGVATWNRSTQIRVPGAVRAELAGILLDGDFDVLAASYGGREVPGATGSALRVTCLVELEIGGLRKTSIQLADGPQSRVLGDLADALLDRVEPLAADGVSAFDLADGLRKLADGRLSAEALQLRLVRLPAAEEGGEGSILVIGEGRETRTPYTPGRRIGEDASRSLTAENGAELARALLEADVTSMPSNLWSADHLELDVQVLGHRATVVARPFSRLSPGDPVEQRRRFERLVAILTGDGPAEVDGG